MRWPFGRRKPTAFELLSSAQWTCRCCGQRHTGMFDMGAVVPNVWPKEWEKEHNGALRLDGDFLSEDFCVVDGEHFMVRAVLPIPVHGLAQDFGYGVWCSLSKENFLKYVDRFDTSQDEDEEPWWSWLCNQAQPYFDGEEPLGGWLRSRAGRMRPTYHVDDTEHPLAIAQCEGISPEDVLAIYEAYGHAPAA